MRRLRQGETLSGFEARFLRVGGEAARLSCSGALHPGDRLIYLSARDAGQITSELRRFKAIADGTSDFVGLTDMHSRVLFINPAGLAMLGRTGEDPRTMNMRTVRTQEGLAQLEREILPQVLRRGLWSGETEFERIDGAPIPVSQVFFLIRDESGKPEALATIARDITDQKRAEAEMRKFKALVDSTSDLVCIAAPEGQLAYVNAAGLALLGRADEDVAALRLADLFTPTSARAFAEDILPVVREHGLGAWEPEFARRDGDALPTSCVALLLPGAEGAEAVALVARDMSAHRHVDALQQAVRVMGAPIMEVWDSVIAMPVLGLVDSPRASQMTEALLHAVVTRQARVAIIDLTGVQEIDTSTLDHLIRMIGAASLLGTRCVVSGISPAIAQILTQLDVDTSRLQAFRTLKEALRFAIRLPRG
jgi:rsbT co-antagonist protein RsbR